jgi:hypothetical protein
MASNRTHPSLNAHTSPNASHHDISVELPSVDALLVGTLASMTGYAEHQCDQGNARCRNAMAQKIVSNLFFLSGHPKVSTSMAAVVRNLQNHWYTLAALSALENKHDAKDALGPDESKPVATPAAPVLWHSAHTSVQ